MTDQELMQALRCCVSSPKRDGCQDACVFHNGDISHCIPEMGKAAADRLEALVAENAKLICEKSELEQEIGRLEVQNEHFREAAKMMPIRRIYHGVLDTLQHGTFSDEPPSTEGVE